jgi:hypothetical protein
MATLSKGINRKFGVALMVISLVGFLVWLGYYRAEAQAPASGGIVAPNNSGIVTQGQSGGTNIINPAPPRVPLGLYQSGQQIGRVQDFTISADGKQIILTNPRVASASADGGANMEFQNLIVKCPALARMINPNAGFNSSIIVGTIDCAIAGNR